MAFYGAEVFVRRCVTGSRVVFCKAEVKLILEGL